MATSGCKRSTIFYFIKNETCLFVASNRLQFLSSRNLFLLFSNISSNAVRYFISSPNFSRTLTVFLFFLHVHRIYWPLFLIFGLILPLNAPLEYWDESMTETILITGVLRFAITVNVSWLVNSARLVWSMEGKKLIQISDFFNLLYKLFFKIPKSHGTVMINYDGINVE